MTNKRGRKKGGMPGIDLTIRRAVEKGVLLDVYKIQTCYGHTADFSELPFRFFKITKVE